MISIKNSFLETAIINRKFLYCIKRYKSKKKFQKKNPMTTAVNHFDDFYKTVFKERWPSVRLALFSKERKVVVINNFGDSQKTEEFCQGLGAFNLKSFLEMSKNYPTDAQTETDSYQEKSNLKEATDKKLLDEERVTNKNISEEKDNKATKKLLSEEILNKLKEEGVENLMTSMHSDMSKSEIQMDRLILPDSGDANALMHMFIPATQLRGLEHFIPESEYYKYYQEKVDEETKIEPEFELDFPDTLKVYTFDRGDVTEFPDPSKCVNSVYNYLEMDGADVLTALALGVQSNDKVLCISQYSGSIPYCIFQSLRPDVLVCTNKKKVQKTFKEYLYDYSSTWKNMLHITNEKFEEIIYNPREIFDKILLEVPSSNDRRSLFDVEGNFFAVRNIRERLTLPENQTKILMGALKMIQPGGTIVYTTSTLSPVQNERVVSEALKMMFQESRERFTVKDLTPALRHTSMCFNYGHYLKMELGTLIVPFTPLNYGPRYFCKIVKNKEKEEE